jgi:SAM-dependent methyltransferase
MSAGPPRGVHAAGDPSPWVVRFVASMPTTGPVLDVACGAGRHTRFLLELGHRVVAVDRDLSGLADLADHPDLEAIAVDLEDGRPVPFVEPQFAAVVVTNYLHRPILDALVSVVALGGLFVYETFACGNERFGRPRRPEFLLQPGELLEVVRGRLRVVAFEDLVVDEPRAAAVQRIAAVRVSSDAPATDASAGRGPLLRRPAAGSS